MRRFHNRLNPGDQFGRLTVIREEAIQNGKDWRSVRIRYICECSCGRLLKSQAYRLVSGHIRSCGCLQKDKASEMGKSKKTHGYAKNINRIPEYMTWVRMRRRCKNPRSQDYLNYGGRGIKVCKAWGSFLRFLKDMGRRPGKGYSIGRMNNDGDYEPQNCRWETIKQQNRNKRTARLLKIGGETRTLPEWSDLSRTGLEKIRARLGRGWSPREAVFGKK